jgi:hypothetical protein
MPNTAGSSFFSWLRFGKKKPKKTGRRDALVTGRGPIPGHREPDQPTRDVRLPDALREENARRERERLDRERFERERAAESRTPPPLMSPPPLRTAPQDSPAPKPKSSSETVVMRVPEHQSQGDVVGVLLGVLGPLKNEIYRVYAGSTRLGRIDPDNPEKGGEFSDRDMVISRQHGTLVRLEDGAFHIKPVKAISVNGEQLEEAGEMLRDGDTLQMGQSTFRFRVLL